jgi:hypothetical protein
VQRVLVVSEHSKFRVVHKCSKSRDPDHVSAIHCAQCGELQALCIQSVGVTAYLGQTRPTLCKPSGSGDSDHVHEWSDVVLIH